MKDIIKLKRKNIFNYFLTIKMKKKYCDCVFLTFFILKNKINN
jgi:hypothetical protein